MAQSFFLLLHCAKIWAETFEHCQHAYTECKFNCDDVNTFDTETRANLVTARLGDDDLNEEIYTHDEGS